MDYEFRDIDIPPRQTEYALPLDTSLAFRFTENPAGLRLTVFSAGKPRAYAGRGQILLTDGFTRVKALSLLDPFLQDRRVIPAKHFKIFFRVGLPRLRGAGVNVTCDLTFSDTPAARITVRRCAENAVDYELRWAAPRSNFRQIQGLEGYIASGTLLYRGSLDELRSIPHMSDGVYTARDSQTEILYSLYASSPYLFDVRDPEFLKKGVLPNGEFPYAAAQTPAAPKTSREWGGPSLIRSHMTSQNRSGTSRFVHFVVEAKRLASHTVERADFVPFSCYWPTYANMSREQRAWYFHWRSEFIKGNLLKTDLSYIFVAVYEIINRAFPAGIESLERLLALWEGYRGAFPRLDYYMAPWCVDYVIVNGIDFPLSDILKRIPLAVRNMRPFLEIFVNDALKTGIHALPFDILCEFSEYNIKNSRFYKEHEDICRDAVRSALAEIDRSLREAKGTGLLEYFALRPKREVWESFSGAVCGRAASKRIEVEYIPFSKNGAIRAFLNSVMRYTENLLRKREKYTGRLRGIELSEAVRAAIDRTLARGEASQAASAEVFINLGLAAELERDSWDNTRRLVEAVRDSLPEAELTVEPETPFAEPGAPEDTDGFIQPLADEEKWQAFMDGLTPLARGFVIKLLSGVGTEELAADATAEFTFPEAVFDDINERAAEIIGDIIIDTERNEIYEEHREALAAVL